MCISLKCWTNMNNNMSYKHPLRNITVFHITSIFDAILIHVFTTERLGAS